jgi:hypothetical protein
MRKTQIENKQVHPQFINHQQPFALEDVFALAYGSKEHLNAPSCPLGDLSCQSLSQDLSTLDDLMSVAVSNCAERPEPTWGQSIFLANRTVTIPPSPGVIPLPSPRRPSAGGFSFPEF